MPDLPKPATAHTAAANAVAAAMVSFDDPGDFERAGRGLIATHGTGRISLGSHPAWDVAHYDFLRDGSSPPDTAHPGLWRQARLNAIHGLFEVADGVWQARGYDISNITFIAGNEGWVVIDPLTTAATAAACLDLANATLGHRPATTVIYTHSHSDHYGGVLGVTSSEAREAGEVRIVAPEGFLREVVNENVIGGPIMGRRAAFQFGPLLPKGPRGQIDAGLGKGIPLGPIGLLAPTDTVSETGQELVLDGVRVVFQNTPDTEAPAEMNFFFPDLGLLCMAENCTHTLHNTYPIRGAQTRDALAWSKYINEALLLWGAHTDVMFASHHWPRFGTDDVREFLELQRDVYRWLHDQTMRLANLGLVPTEIAATLQMPGAFGGHSHVHGYYGTVSHNSKSVYNKYLGWYDGNPANLDPLPPVEAGRRYVELMGGADEVLAQAREAFDAGEYRWVAQIVNHVVFADPANDDARHLQADALEQLGYQAESATWRNAYLYGAHELRNGTPQIGAPKGRLLGHAMTAEQLFDGIGVRFDPGRFSRPSARMNLSFTDLDEQHVLGVARSTIHHDPHTADPAADVSVAMSRTVLVHLLGGLITVDEAVAAGDLEVDGDLTVFAALLDALEVFTTQAIIEP